MTWKQLAFVDEVLTNPMTESLDLDGNHINDVGKLILNNPTELTISTGAVTVTQSYHVIDTEGDAATDDLETINGGTAGQILVLHAAFSTRKVVLKDSTGNLMLSGDMPLYLADDSITLIFYGTLWYELARSDIDPASYMLIDGSRAMTGDIDLDKNDLKAACIEQLASAPSTPGTAQIYYNTTDDHLYVNVV